MLYRGICIREWTGCQAKSVVSEDNIVVLYAHWYLEGGTIRNGGDAIEEKSTGENEILKEELGSENKRGLTEKAGQAHISLHMTPLGDVLSASPFCQKLYRRPTMPLTPSQSVSRAIAPTASSTSEAKK